MDIITQAVTLLLGGAFSDQHIIMMCLVIPVAGFRYGMKGFEPTFGRRAKDQTVA